MFEGLAAGFVLSVVALLYALSLAAALWGIRRGIGGIGRMPAAFAWAGLALQTAAIAVYAAARWRVPLGNPYEVLVCLVWAFVLLQLLGSAAFKARAILCFSMPVAAFLTVLPLCCPLFLPYLRHDMGGLKAISSAHALFAVFSYGAFALAGALAALYLVQRRALRMKESISALGDAPSLKRMFAAVRWSMLLAAILMFVAVVLGTLDAVFFAGAKLNAAHVVKFSLGGLVLSAQVFLAALAWARAAGESKVCAWVLIALAVSFLMLVPIEFRNFLWSDACNFPVKEGI